MPDTECEQEMGVRRPALFVGDLVLLWNRQTLAVSSFPLPASYVLLINTKM